jgi:hypothetical protein
MDIGFSQPYSCNGERRIDVFAGEYFTRLRLARPECADSNKAWFVRYIDRSEGKVEILAGDLRVQEACEFAGRELERMMEAGEKYLDFDRTPIFEGLPSVTPKELVKCRRKIIADYENNRGRKGYGRKEIENQIWTIWGVGPSPFGVLELETFFCQSRRPFARSVRFRLGLAPCGLWVWDFSADFLNPLIRSDFYMTAGAPIGYDEFAWKAVPFATREEAMRTGVEETIRAIEKFLEERPNDYEAHENAAIVEAWLKSLTERERLSRPCMACSTSAGPGMS